MAETPAPDQTGVFHRVKALLGKLLWIVPMVLLLVVALLIFAERIPLRPPFAPFTTQGRIFVESPEVYTRERLVNDRYEQAYWLEEQLTALDQADNFTSTRRDLAFRLSGNPNAETAADTINEFADPPFEYKFQLKAALRDKIRQLILENQLDDRHDRTGNSVYGLKFDTTVIPGRNTRQRAYVRLAIKPHDSPDNDAPFDVFRHQSLTDTLREPGRLKNFPAYYEQWLDDIEWRLNAYIEGDTAAPATGEFGPTPYAEMLREALSKTLSISPIAIDLPDLTETKQATVPIAVPAPWRNFINLELLLSADATGRGQFDVRPAYDSFLLIDNSDPERIAEFGEMIEDDWIALSDTYLSSGLVVMDDREIEIVLERAPHLSPDGGITGAELRRISPRIDLESGTLKKVIEMDPGYEDCLVYREDACRLHATGYFVQSGLYNFVSEMIGIDSYLYAVFPKTDASGLLENSLINGGVSLPSKIGDLSLSVEDQTRTSRAVATQVSFSETGEVMENRDISEIAFGWVIGSDRIEQPTQKSQFVLISLPAYLTDVEIEIETGWLDRRSRFPDRENVVVNKMNVKLPPNFEAFDRLIMGERQNGPSIYDGLMNNTRLQACGAGAVVIPGARLWRSTVVTMDGTAADKIQVMPDMRGIIATFDEVPSFVPAPEEPGLNTGTTGQKFYNPVIRVWTSEGSDTISGKVQVFTPEGCQTRSKVSGNNLP